MKHLIALLSFIFCAITTSQAQSVYDYVLNNATRTVNSPVSNFTQTQIAQFKRTALVYLKRKAYEETDTIPSLFLDTQAYYMSEFITLFFEHVSKSKRLSEDKLQERIMILQMPPSRTPCSTTPTKRLRFRLYSTMAKSPPSVLTPIGKRPISQPNRRLIRKIRKLPPKHLKSVNP